MLGSMNRDLFEQLQSFFARRGVGAYLVGGTVRDQLLGRSTYDIDLMMDADALALGRELADALDGAFVALDEVHATARVVLRKRHGPVECIDLAAQRGGSLEADLAARDFSVNALAIPLRDAAAGRVNVIDPLGGRADLAAGRLRAVTPDSFRDDPLRLLRAVRLASVLGFSIEPQTRQWMAQHAALIDVPSAERIRDELVRLFAQPHSARYLRLMDATGLLSPLLPELVACKQVTQPAAHQWNVFDHLIASVGRLDGVLYGAGLSEFEIAAEPPDTRATYEELGRVLSDFQPDLGVHLGAELVGGRRRYTLLTLLTLLHDVGKPLTRTVDQDGTIHFHRHEQVSAGLVGDVLRRLRFGRLEVQIGRRVIRHHMRPKWLATADKVTRRAVYRFFRETGDAGVDAVLLSLADTLAKKDYLPPHDEWRAQLDITRRLLAAWFDQRDQVVQPPPFVRGDELISRFDLIPGPIVGDVLEALQEAQATGHVTSRAEALAYAREWLDAHR